MSTKLTLTGAINYENDIDNFLAAKVIALVEQSGAVSNENVIGSSPSSFIGPVSEVEQTRFAGRSLMQAFEETAAKTKPFMAVVAGYRAMEESGGETFTSKQIIEQFRSVGVSPRNLDREIRKAVGAGLIFAETGKKGSYRVTELALKAFDKGFDQLKIRSVKTASGRTKSSPSGVKLDISDAVRSMSMGVSMEGYLNYHDISTKSERIIWILIFAAKNDVISLNSKEIEHLANEVRDKISAPSIPALTKSSIQKGYLARSDNQYRLLHQGDVYIKGKNGD